MTYFQSTIWKRVILQWRNLINTILARWARWIPLVISHIDSIFSWYYVIEWYFMPMVLAETHNPGLTEKKIKQTQVRDIIDFLYLINYFLIPFGCQGLFILTVQQIHQLLTYRDHSSLFFSGTWRYISVYWFKSYFRRVPFFHRIKYADFFSISPIQKNQWSILRPSAFAFHI